MRFAWLRLRKPRLTMEERAEWLQAACVLVLRRLAISLSVQGPAPRSGLIVSNHLSYLDILLYAASTPCIFVSKAEVRRWPGFGRLAQYGGTIFIERGSRTSAAETAMHMEYALRSGVTVMLFPEGTSTDGTTLLPFHSFLFEPAIEAESRVTSAAVSYQAEGAEERDLCYYGDIRFKRHLLETIGRKAVVGRVRFDAKPRIYTSRKQAANDTWERVARLRLGASMETPRESLRRTSFAGEAR
ncbi:MAG TPA: lysophospholipid acyltransferase family protein [Alloacidobacterium sp.]|nr:lysophospholipid acyltransferase family protein [Alloacidobacterium sp.]